MARNKGLAPLRVNSLGMTSSRLMMRGSGRHSSQIWRRSSRGTRETDGIELCSLCAMNLLLSDLEYQVSSEMPCMSQAHHRVMLDLISPST